MFFTNFLRTPLTGVSQLSITSAVTKGKEIGTTLVGSAWTRVISPFISPVVVDDESASDPLRASRRLLAARLTPLPIISLVSSTPVHADIGVDQHALPLPIGPYRSPARSALRECVRTDERAVRYQKIRIRLSKRRRSAARKVKSKSIAWEWSWQWDPDTSTAEYLVSSLGELALS